MRGRYLGANEALTYGGEYVVLSVSAGGPDGVELLVLTDDALGPGWFPAEHFDLTSDTVPSNWQIRVGNGGSPGRLEVGPGPWLEPGFMDDYWGEDSVAVAAAQDAFTRELEVILHES